MVEVCLDYVAFIHKFYRYVTPMGSLYVTCKFVISLEGVSNSNITTVLPSAYILFSICHSALQILHSNQLIQLVLASAFHFTEVFLFCVQNSIELFPVMSHTPNFESFHPPNGNGSLGTGTPILTPIIPALARSMTSLANPPFSVKTAAAFP